MIKAIIITLIISLTAIADSTLKIKYGVAVDANKKGLLNDSYRAVDIGYYSNLEKSVSWAVTAGYYGDKSIKLNTGFACAQFGVEIKPFDWMYIDQYFGPCYFHDARGLISGKLNFATNTGMGWRDSTGSQVGINIKHFSNAGLSVPNTGVNLLMLNMSFGL